MGEAPFVRHQALRNILGSNDLSRKELYQDLVVRSASDHLVDRLGWSMEEVRSHWNWAPGSGFLNNWLFARNALPLFNLNFKLGLADKPDCHRCSRGLEETAEHDFSYCERVLQF